MAYADGELDAKTRAAVEMAVAEDETLAERVALFADTRRAAKGAMDAYLKEPVPAALEQRVKAMLTASAGGASADAGKIVAFKPRHAQTAPTSAPRRLWELPLAASIALIAGLAGGYFAAQTPPEAGGSVRIAALGQSEIASALATVPAGNTREIEGGGTFKAIASFRDSSGVLCREFEYDEPQGSALVAVACHDNAAWDVRFSVATNQTSEGYAPASSLDALETYLGAIGAGTPLSIEDERKALEALGEFRSAVESDRNILPS